MEIQMKQWKDNNYHPEIEDKSRAIRKQVGRIKSKTGKERNVIAKQSIEIGLDILEKQN